MEQRGVQHWQASNQTVPLLSFYSERKISQSYMAYQASMTHFKDLTDAYILCNIKFVHSLQASKQCKGQGLSALTMFL